MEIAIGMLSIRMPKWRLYIESLDREARLKLSIDARKAAAKCVSQFDQLTREQQQDLINRFASNLVLGEIVILTKEEFQNRNKCEQLSLLS